MVVKFSMSSSTPEIVALAGIDAETSPPRVTSAMLFRFVVFWRHFKETLSEEGNEGTYQPLFHCFIPAVVHMLCRRTNSLCKVISPNQLVRPNWPFTGRRQLTCPCSFPERRRDPEWQVTQQIRADFVVNHQLDYDLSPRSRVRDFWVPQRAVGSSDLQEAEQRLDAPIFERRGDLMLSRYSVRVHPGYVGCRICQAGIKGDREVWGPLR